ncbi:serine/threonine-protein kinase [Adlercreutzia sp. R25]|uniref:non-specific serine/threonine protein kinase n=1 Tax=Adlercreutzia shanghongiae TaxID=3111773 RepID=A0ABU6IZB0_9ACTN|nr:MULTISPECIES: serine/threonine-protein kinase [unclassified Adlercreutzia]MEC4272838.1 serine/threonine-protein kinase [Adlercreutzia sp. R25]MEC4295048.1 serine/threonine-protein kinase [Adlercreutzia sp. R22]
MEHDPLAAYLDALARDDCYRVAQVLKTAPHETTEVVYFVGANAAELGPFVRKRISGDASMGDAYGHLLAAQRAGRRFRHLPRIYDVHESDGDLVVVMEYVAGRTLRDEVYERDASLELARRWFPLLCDGVSELHEQFPAPIIHRDLKPTNVVVGGEGLTIIDFGIARAFRDGAESDTSHFGTRSYAPPEQFGFRQTDVRSDVYALGMILYYLLTEKDPSPAVTAEGFADPAIPAPLRPVLARACAFDPAVRFSSVRELKEAFLAACPSAESHATSAIAPRRSSSDFRPAGSPKIPSGRFASRVRGAFATLDSSETAGAVWDAVILLLWLLFACVLTTMPFASEGSYASWPTWLLMFQYWVFGYPFFTGLLFVLADVRIVRRVAPSAWLLKGSRLRALGVILVVAGVLSVAVSMALADALGLPV